MLGGEGKRKGLSQVKATGGAAAHVLMTADRKTKNSRVMDSILHAGALEQMVPRGQSVCSMDEQAKSGKLSQLWKNLPPHSYTHTHTHTHTSQGLFNFGSPLIFVSYYQVLLFA